MTAAAGGQKSPKLQGASGAKTHLKVDGEDSGDPNGQRQSVTARWTRRGSQKEREESKSPIINCFPPPLTIKAFL